MAWCATWSWPSSSAPVRDYEAFIAALTIPDLVFQILAGGAVGSAFIPVFMGYFSRDDHEGAWRLTGQVMTMALIITVPALIVLALPARPLTEIIVPAGTRLLEGSRHRHADAGSCW